MLSDNYILRFSLIWFSLALFSCSSEENKPIDTEVNSYGGHIHINEKENFVSLNPHTIEDAHSLHIVNQLYEGLVRFTASGDTIELCLAKALYMDSTNMMYRFVLKDSIYFHDNLCFKNSKGAALSTKDIEFTFKQILNSDPENIARSYFIDILKGGRAFYNSKGNDNSIEGVRVVNNKIIEFRLSEPDPLFLYKLASTYGFIFSERAYTFYGRRLRTHPVGTGPFYLKTESDLIEDQKIILHKHPKYHQTINGSRLPHLDMVSFHFLKESELEQGNFMNGALDVIHNQKKKLYQKIALEKNPDYDDFGLIVSQDLSAYFLGFNNQTEPFNKLLNREGISKILNRQEIFNSVYPENFYKEAHFINNQLANSFFIPDSLKISFEPELGKNLLNSEETKIKNNKVLNINSLGDINTTIANGIRSDLKAHTNINIAINPIPLAYHKQSLSRKDNNIFFTEINYMYPDPDFILRKFYTYNTTENISSFSNPEFDKFYYAFTKSNRDINALLASDVLMEELPMIPLFDVTNIIVYKPHIKNFVWNKMNYLDLRKVHIKEPKILNPI